MSKVRIVIEVKVDGTELPRLLNALSKLKQKNWFNWLDWTTEITTV